MLPRVAINHEVTPVTVAQLRDSCATMGAAMPGRISSVPFIQDGRDSGETSLAGIRIRGLHFRAICANFFLHTQS